MSALHRFLPSPSFVVALAALAVAFGGWSGPERLQFSAMRVVLAVVVALMAAAPASAVVGGTPLPATKVPWFASFAGCGGTLVAPDRILTAGHCVAHRSLADFEHIAVGGTVRRGVRVAMHPNWRAQNGRNRLDDVALIALDQPVTAVKAVKLGGAVPARVRVLGRGLSTAPRRGEPGGIGGGALREAVLRSLSDRACART